VGWRWVERAVLRRGEGEAVSVWEEEEYGEGDGAWADEGGEGEGAGWVDLMLLIHPGFIFWAPATLGEMAEGFVSLVGLFLLFLGFTTCFGCEEFLTDVCFLSSGLGNGLRMDEPSTFDISYF